MMIPAEYHEEYRKFYGITGERWNDLSLMDKRLMVRAVGVCWWYLSTRAQRDLVTVLKRRHERVLDRRMIAQMTPRDFEGDRKR
jgi:hypothetical protein